MCQLKMNNSMLSKILEQEEKVPSGYKCHFVMKIKTISCCKANNVIWVVLIYESHNDICATFVARKFLPLITISAKKKEAIMPIWRIISVFCVIYSESMFFENKSICKTEIIPKTGGNLSSRGIKILPGNSYRCKYKMS